MAQVLYKVAILVYFRNLQSKFTTLNCDTKCFHEMKYQSTFFKDLLGLFDNLAIRAYGFMAEVFPILLFLYPQDFFSRKDEKNFKEGKNPAFPFFHFTSCNSRMRWLRIFLLFLLFRKRRHLVWHFFPFWEAFKREKNPKPIPKFSSIFLKWRGKKDFSEYFPFLPFISYGEEKTKRLSGNPCEKGDIWQLWYHWEKRFHIPKATLFLFSISNF